MPAQWAWCRPTSCSTRRSTRWTAQIADARAGGALVESLVRRTREEGIAGNWEARASEIVTGRIAPAMEAQLAELQRERAVADSDPGIWSQPRGDEWYDWSLTIQHHHQHVA